MKFSFVIPVYNCKAWLEACVDSILGVNLPDLEVILVDDGSTDGSGALCDQLAQKNNQIRVVHQPNGGVSAARNRGIREAKGEYVLFADSDDTFDSDALRQVLSDPGCTQADMTVFGMSFDYYYHGKCYRSDSLFYGHHGLLGREQWGTDFEQLFRDNSLSPLWNKVFRRALLQDLELNADMFLYEDFEFVLRYMQRCGEIYNVPKAVYRYRQAEDEGNAPRRLKRIDSIPAFLQPIEAALENLCNCNENLSREAADTVLLQLHLTLAREKISVSQLPVIQNICEEFSGWHCRKTLRQPQNGEKFFKNLLEKKALTLLLSAKKSALRHRVAVWAKGNGLYKRGG